MAGSAAVVAFIAIWVATLCTWDFIMDETSRKMQRVTCWGRGNTVTCMLGYIPFPDHRVIKVKFCSKSIYKIHYFVYLGIDLINKLSSFIGYLLVQPLFYLLIHILSLHYNIAILSPSSKRHRNKSKLVVGRIVWSFIYSCKVVFYKWAIAFEWGSKSLI